MTVPYFETLFLAGGGGGGAVVGGKGVFPYTKGMVLGRLGLKRDIDFVHCGMDPGEGYSGIIVTGMSEALFWG